MGRGAILGHLSPTVKSGAAADRARP